MSGWSSAITARPVLAGLPRNRCPSRGPLAAWGCRRLPCGRRAFPAAGAFRPRCAAGAWPFLPGASPPAGAFPVVERSRGARAEAHFAPGPTGGWRGPAAIPRRWATMTRSPSCTFAAGYLEVFSIRKADDHLPAAVPASLDQLPDRHLGSRGTCDRRAAGAPPESDDRAPNPTPPPGPPRRSAGGARRAAGRARLRWAPSARGIVCPTWIVTWAVIPGRSRPRCRAPAPPRHRSPRSGRSSG